jgi:hypothetical protein
MEVEILDILNKKKVKAEIILADITKMPLKKEGWHFDWKRVIKNKNTKTYILRSATTPQTIEGILQLKIEKEMLIMDLIEIAPHNIGQKKRHDDVAGCLISFSCRESFYIQGVYQGYLSFVSKTSLIQWYCTKYGAIQVTNQNMYIDPRQGLKLIKKYLSK